MAFKKNHKSILYTILLTIIAVSVACNLPSPSKSSTQDGATQTENQAQIPPSQSINPSTSNAGITESLPCIEGIIPGKSNKDDVIAIMGNPATSNQDGSNESLLYPSPLSGQYHTVYLNNELVDWVSIVLDEDNPLTWEDVKAQYGEPANISFSDYLQGSRNFAYPDQGLSFIADAELDVVFIQGCFIPASLENYMSSYGDLLPQEDPFIK